MKSKNLDARVKAANKLFYNTVADVYEKVDGRRSEEVILWLNDIARNLSNSTGGESLLDIGCGSGVLMKAGGRHFKHIFGIDISSNILKCIDTPSDGLVCGDLAFLPFKNESFDAISCFAVLHHIYDHTSIFKEAHRVLKKGGILYTDHDMDAAFMKRFNLPMMVYRNLFNMKKRYLKEKRELKRELYDLSEIHASGIDSGRVVKQLKEIGFVEIKQQYHWFGLNKVINKIIGKKLFQRGFAPLISIIARK